jgi:peroxiredoxin-like protein
MKPLPHDYSVQASADATGSVRLGGDGLPALESAPPKEFGGPGDKWSPEELLLAAVVDCFILTFRAVARASKLPWNSIEARVEGRLERVEHITRFTGITIHVALSVDSEVSEDKALALLEKAEKSCLVTNSLAVPVELEARVVR